MTHPTAHDAAAYDIKWANSNLDVIHRVQYGNTYYDLMKVNRPTRNVSFMNGNLGIGTSTPRGKLDILSATDEVALRLSHPTADDAAAYDIKWANSNADVIHRVQYGNTYYDFMKVNRPTRNVSFMNGNLGIGTSIPRGKLDILSGTDEVALRLTHPTAHDAAAYDIKWANSNADVIHRVQYGNTYYDFMKVNRPTRNVSFMNGSVGIGTTNPQSKLAVNGTITAKELTITADGWPDFIFSNKYKLRTLEEVESFIEENNHLPDIPSEKEVLENGLQVGEINAKLLQKIEELTLYMIEQNKKTDKLIEKVEILETENLELKDKVKKMENPE